MLQNILAIIQFFFAVGLFVIDSKEDFIFARKPKFKVTFRGKIKILLFLGVTVCGIIGYFERKLPASMIFDFTPYFKYLSFKYETNEFVVPVYNEGDGTARKVNVTIDKYFLRPDSGVIFLSQHRYGDLDVPGNSTYLPTDTINKSTLTNSVKKGLTIVIFVDVTYYRGDEQRTVNKIFAWRGGDGLKWGMPTDQDRIDQLNNYRKRLK